MWFVGVLVATVLLVQMYSRPGMSGFLWLMMAVAVWPVMVRLLGAGSTMMLPVMMARSGSTMTQAAFWLSALSGVEALLGVMLLLVAMFTLKRQVQGQGVG